MGRPPHTSFFFFNDTATTEIYTLSLHDALPIWSMSPMPIKLRGSKLASPASRRKRGGRAHWLCACLRNARRAQGRSEEHTSELQSQSNLVCRLLLEKKNLFEPSGAAINAKGHEA